MDTHQIEEFHKKFDGNSLYRLFLKLGIKRTTLDTFVGEMRFLGYPRFREILKSKKWSMLHLEVLVVMDYLARRASGRIVELGPYLGGATTVLAAAAKEESLPIITVEKGGAHNHDAFPSNDILRDLQNNLERHGVRDRVTIVEGDSKEPTVIAEIGRLLDIAKIGLLVIDADGNVGVDLGNLGPYCAQDCLLVIDDYASADAAEKASLIKPVVDRLKGQGRLIEFGVYGWGTWIGQLSTMEPED